MDPTNTQKKSPYTLMKLKLQRRDAIRRLDDYDKEINEDRIFRVHEYLTMEERKKYQRLLQVFRPYILFIFSFSYYQILLFWFLNITRELKVEYPEVHMQNKGQSWMAWPKHSWMWTVPWSTVSIKIILTVFAS